MRLSLSVRKIAMLVCAMAVMGSLAAFAQETVTIKGLVLDADGVTPLVGAGVRDVNTGAGVVSDFDGKYEIAVKVPTTLEFSYIGSATQRAEITSSTSPEMNIVLQSDATLLDDVVVVGFGTQKKANLTGSVATVDSKILEQRPVPSAMQALQGADPSMYISFGSGSPDASQSITIRGNVSINSGSPLILVDGVEMELKYINPNDIASVSILKDASASAIYGAKASAGVILVTTKSGSANQGRAKINVSSNLSLVTPTTSTDFITSGYDQVRLNNEFYNKYNDHYKINVDLDELYARRNDKVENPERPWVVAGEDGYWRYYGNFDWYHFIFNDKRLQQEYNVSANGGTENVKYYVSARYYDQEGVINQTFGDNRYRSFSFRGKMDANLTPRLHYSLNAAFADNILKYTGEKDYEQAIWNYGINCSPAFSPYNPDGSIVSLLTKSVHGFSRLQVQYGGALLSEAQHHKKDTRDLTLKNSLTYDIIPGCWTVTASYALNFMNRFNQFRSALWGSGVGPDQITVSQAFDAARGKYMNADYYEEDHDNLFTHTVDAYSNFHKTIGDGHNLSATAGMQYYQYYYRGLVVRTNNMLDDGITAFKTQNSISESIDRVSQNVNALKTLGFFARANYDYKGRYLAEVSFRADGSSRFAKGQRWAMFPSGSLGWRVSEEPFFEPAKSVMNNLKVRYSLGSLGNQQMSDYYPTWEVVTGGSVTNYSLDGTTRINTANVSNPVSSDLTWETVTTNNLGFDFGFLGGRLNASADFYIRDTKNMLTESLTLPSVYGASTPKENCANLRTKGYELSVSWNDSFKLGSSDFIYGVSASLGDYIAVITKFNNPNKSLSSRYEGQVLGEIWGYQVDGLFKTDEEAWEYMSEIDATVIHKSSVFNSTNPEENYLRAGDVKFADLNGDGKITSGSNTVDDPGDRRIIGNSRPRYLYSFNINLGWHGFDFSTFWQGVGHRDVYPDANGDGAYLFWGMYNTVTANFVPANWEDDLWADDGSNPNAYFPRRRDGYARDGALKNANSYYLQNAAYIRLKNLSAGYTFHFKTPVVDKLRIGVNAENLWYWSPMKKHCKTIDPELMGAGYSDGESRSTGVTYARTFTFNLQLTF